MKTAVLYCSHLLNDELKFFINHGYFKAEDVDFHICFNGNFKIESMNQQCQLLGLTNLTFHQRPNINFDFGCWSDLIINLDLLSKYDYFIMLNCSCYGPFLPVYVKDRWVDLFIKMITDQIKLVGPTINWYDGQAHVQSYLLCTDRIGLQIGLETEIFSQQKSYAVKKDVIDQCEIRYSQEILKKGYQINCLLTGYQPLLNDYGRSEYPYGSFKNPDGCDPLYSQGYFGINPHPYEVMFFKSNRNVSPEILTKYVQFHNYQNSDLYSQIMINDTKLIVMAQYGVNEKFLDVTDTVNKICYYQSQFIVSNNLFTDPVPNNRKFLKVTLTNKITKIIEESCKIDVNQLLSPFGVPMSSQFADYSNLLSHKKGLEIGGPSPAITKIGIYTAPESLDNVNFCQNTLWNINEEGKPYTFKDKTIPGQVYIADLVNLTPFQDRTYDFVVASHVMEHLVNPLLGLSEITRVLKHNGLCILILPDKRYTFDHLRPTTDLQELVQHFQNNRDEKDVMDHVESIVKDYDLTMDRPAGTKDQFIKRCMDHQNNRALHVHVFDFQLIIECLRYFNYDILAVQSVHPCHQLVIGIKNTVIP
jgi:SAM-dependent methyltransferase